MRTSDERREVASALRGDPNDTLIPQSRDGFEGMTYNEAAYRFWNMCRRVRSAADVDIAYSTTSVLADLIDPPTSRVTCMGSFTASHDFTRWKCGKCGAYAFTPRGWIAPRYCQWCGERVVWRDGYE